jgi:hypothetical protein
LSTCSFEQIGLQELFLKHCSQISDTQSDFSALGLSF